MWWSPVVVGLHICYKCLVKKQSKTKNESHATSLKRMKLEEQRKEQKLRKSTRSTRYKSRTGTIPLTHISNNSGGTYDASINLVEGNGGNSTINSGSKSQSKGRNRRNIFKRAPLKQFLKQTSETHMVKSLIHQNIYLQVGDIVSLMDHDGKIYYAQIRGLLLDTYCEKSAFLTWLIPTKCSPDPKLSFDAATYLIGPDEEQSRKLSCLTFVMHAPSNYYHDRTTPFPLPDSLTSTSEHGGYIWARLTENACSITIA